jgi:hypothetical protein
MLVQQTQTRTDQNQLRFVWNNPEKEGIQYGTFLFNDPQDAEPALIAMRKEFPDCVIWLEDREHNRIQI